MERKQLRELRKLQPLFEIEASFITEFEKETAERKLAFVNYFLPDPVSSMGEKFTVDIVWNKFIEFWEKASTENLENKARVIITEKQAFSYCLLKIYGKNQDHHQWQSEVN